MEDQEVGQEEGRAVWVDHGHHHHQAAGPLKEGGAKHNFYYQILV